MCSSFSPKRTGRDDLSKETTTTSGNLYDDLQCFVYFNIFFVFYITPTVYNRQILVFISFNNNLSIKIFKIKYWQLYLSPNSSQYQNLQSLQRNGVQVHIRAPSYYYIESNKVCSCKMLKLRAS